MVDIKKIEKMLTTAIFEVFEKMYYLFIEPLPRDSGEYQMKASIHFSGQVCGTMEVSVSRGIAETMVENMLNLGPEEMTETVMADCVKESVNMICGDFVRRLDPEKAFLLSIPTFEMITGMPQPRDAREGEIRLAFTAEGGGIEVSMTTSDFLSRDNLERCVEKGP